MGETSGRPSVADTVQARFSARWDIFREVLEDGTHGDWIARLWSSPGQSEDSTTELRASRIDELERLLETDEDEDAGGAA